MAAHTPGASQGPGPDRQAERHKSDQASGARDVQRVEVGDPGEIGS